MELKGQVNHYEKKLQEYEELLSTQTSYSDQILQYQTRERVYITKHRGLIYRNMKKKFNNLRKN